MASLGDLVSDVATGIRREGEEGQGLPFVATGAVSAGLPWLDRAPTETTTVDPRGRVVREGDLLLVARGIDTKRPIRCAKVVFDSSAAFAESLVRLRPNTAFVDPDYLRLFLTSRLGQQALSSVATGTVITNLPQRSLLQAQIRLPSLPDQRSIAADVAPLERVIVESSRLLKSSEAFHEALQEALLVGLRIPGQASLDSPIPSPIR
jgi:hypothetical protein